MLRSKMLFVFLLLLFFVPAFAGYVVIDGLMEWFEHLTVGLYRAELTGLRTKICAGNEYHLRPVADSSSKPFDAP